MNIVDPHIHLFNLDKGDYHWLKPHNAPYWPDKNVIERNFNESDLRLYSELNLVGFVHIEAGFNNAKPWKEIEWLESHCTKPFKSVASIDLTLSTRSFNTQLAKLLSLTSVAGCRHILDDDFSEVLQHPNALLNFKALAKHHLHFELQMPIANLKAVNLLNNVLIEVPTLTIIINHCGWPPFSKSANDYRSWHSGLQQLSLHEQCSIKCSGWEMTDREYTLNNVIFVLKECIAAFGIHRVMMASNFPLCLFSQQYQNFWQLNASAVQSAFKLNDGQLEMLCSKNAERIYKF
jgi:predicted TIM-barrel fold metal-dependent hydrolase